MLNFLPQTILVCQNNLWWIEHMALMWCSDWEGMTYARWTIILNRDQWSFDDRYQNSVRFWLESLAFINTCQWSRILVIGSTKAADLIAWTELIVAITILDDSLKCIEKIPPFTYVQLTFSRSGISTFSLLKYVSTSAGRAFSSGPATLLFVWLPPHFCGATLLSSLLVPVANTLFSDIFCCYCCCYCCCPCWYLLHNTANAHHTTPT